MNSRKKVNVLNSIVINIRKMGMPNRLRDSKLKSVIEI